MKKKENVVSKMKITCKEDRKLNYHELSIGYHPKNKDVIELLLKLIDDNLGEIEVFDECFNYYMITIMSVYYIEIVDHKMFVYTKDNVYRKNSTLKSIKHILQLYGFFQVNVRTMVNKYHIVSYKVDKDCRRVICLDNKEQVVVNRNYREELKKHVTKV